MKDTVGDRFEKFCSDVLRNENDFNCDFANKLYDPAKLQERIDYLERSNDRREDIIIDLRNQNAEFQAIVEEIQDYVLKRWYSKNTTPIENYAVGNWKIELYKILKGE